MPLALLADTECEDFEAALATNVLGPFRLTKALLGLLAASARESRARGARAVVVNVSSDAAVTPYAGWGAYGASKAALAHMRRIWHEELAPHGIAVVAVDPGDMDTPLHAAAVPDADPATLKRPRDAAREIVAPIASRAPARADARSRAGSARERRRPARCSGRATRSLLVVDGAGRISHRPRSALADLLAPGDLVVANDAATLPASLAGVHCATGAAIEVRLAGRRSLAADDVRVLHRASSSAPATTARGPRTAPLPPPLAAGDTLVLGPLAATVDRIARPSAPGRAALRRRRRRDPRRHRASRPAGPVRARRRAARALGRVDRDRGAAGRVRAAVGRLRPRLATARSRSRGAASASRR